MALALSPVLAALYATGAWAQPALDRTQLPIREPRIPHSPTLDVRDAKMPQPFDVRAPKGAPKVVIALVDDLGFGATGSFGGPVPTQVLDRLAAEGWMVSAGPAGRLIAASAASAP